MRVVFAALFGVLVVAGCAGDDGRSGGTLPFMPTSTASGADDGDADGAKDSDGGETSASATGGASSSTTTAPNDASGSSDATGSTGDLDPPAGGSSGGSGGGPAGGEVRTTATGITYRVIAPAGAGPLPLMIVYSGTEGGAQMTMNLQGLSGPTGNNGYVFAVLDGTTYFGNGQAGADVLDEIRTQYDIHNDQTYLLSESAGTSAGLELGFELRQSYFAAFWANDVNASATPSMDAAALGFMPFGNAGPGGDFPDANAIVAGMMGAGYRTPAPAPYDGPGSGTHGASEQFIAALSWFPGKTRL